MFNDSDEEYLSDQYSIQEIEKIGEGAFGKVYKAKDLLDGKICAVKVISKAYFKNAQVEPTIFQSLQHPHIVKLIRVCENKNQIYMVMELMEGGSLGRFISSMKNNRLTDLEAAQIMKHILSAVEYIHSQQIIHRDLKPENILLARKNDLESVRIADFGLSFQFSQEGSFQKLLTQPCGTILYMAPEQVSNQQYGKPVDLWSCGIIMYMLLSMGMHPLFKSDDSKEILIQKIQNPKWEFSENFSKLAIDFFLKLTTLLQSERYSVGQALIHPWVTRRFEDEIPMTFNQRRKIFEKEQRMIMCLKALFILMGLKSNKSTSRQVIFIQNEEQKDIVDEQSELKGLAKKFNVSQKGRFQQRQNFHEMTTPNKLNQLLNYQRSQSPLTRDQLKLNGQDATTTLIRRKTQLASPMIKNVVNIGQRFGQNKIDLRIRQENEPRLVRTQGSSTLIKHDPKQSEQKKSVEKSSEHGNGGGKKLPPIRSIKPKVMPPKNQYYNS